MDAKTAKACEEPGGKHDWRIDPTVRFTGGFLRLVCAECGAVMSGGPGWKPPSADPKDWEKWP